MSETPLEIQNRKEARTMAKACPHCKGTQFLGKIHRTTEKIGMVELLEDGTHKILKENKEVQELPEVFEIVKCANSKCGEALTNEDLVELRSCSSCGKSLEEGDDDLCYDCLVKDREDLTSLSQEELIRRLLNLERGVSDTTEPAKSVKPAAEPAPEAVSEAPPAEQVEPEPGPPVINGADEGPPSFLGDDDKPNPPPMPEPDPGQSLPPAVNPEADPDKDNITAPPFDQGNPQF